MQQGTKNYGRKEDVCKLGTQFLSNEAVNVLNALNKEQWDTHCT